MELYAGAHLIECEIGGRPLFLPLLVGPREAVLFDSGTRSHAATKIPAYLEKIGLAPEALTWLIITHPDLDHCGGIGELTRRYPNLRVACGRADQILVESPEYLFEFRYDHYREEHGIFYDEVTAASIRGSFSDPQPVSLTFVGGETLRLGPERRLEVCHLPGHSHGHLGIYDREHRTLFYGDAIHGPGCKSLSGQWALCPTYLYVEPYLQTIRWIEDLEAESIVGCHWPVWHGAEEIGEFCAASRNFVELADRLIHDFLRRHPSGATLRGLCDVLGGRLGAWSASVNIELCFAFLGHLERGISQGTIAVDQSVRPVIYYRV
jgi:glyoxylase-like metal-dependent hydrolase (beta-lactamase superfamily II)